MNEQVEEERTEELSNERVETQIKFKGTLKHKAIIAVSGTYVGEVCQRDIYLSMTPILCLRKNGEEGDWVLSERTPKTADPESGAMTRSCLDQVLTDEQAKALQKKYKPIVVVCKKRASYQLEGVRITVDELDECGSYVELHASDPMALTCVVELLGLQDRPPVLKTYYEIMLEREIPPFRRKVLLIHEHLGLLAVGIVSGVLTPAAALIGLAASGASRSVSVAMIATMAFGDSFSDGLGIFESKIRERTTSYQTALRYAIGTVIGKVLVPVSMIVIMLFPPWPLAIYITLGWGALILALFTAELAYVERGSVVKTLACKLSVALLIVVLCFALGHLSQKYVD